MATKKREKSQIKSPKDRKTFLEHFQELRMRLTIVFLVFCAGTVVGYFLRGTLINSILVFQKGPLIYTSPAGGLDFIIKVSVMFGLIVSIPMLVYQFFKFLEPALPLYIRLSLIKIVISSVLLVVTGICFTYLVSLPTALTFLNKFSSGQIKSLISTNEYFSFVFIYLFGFGIIFQLPLMLFLLNKVRPLSIRGLFRFEKYIILISFVVAGILTPTPDLINQSVMALPVILLYQISVLLIWLTNGSRKYNNKWYILPMNHEKDSG